MARSDLKEEVEKLKGLLAAEDFYESLSAIGATGKIVSTAYRTLYEKAHADRGEQFHAAIEKIKGRPEWSAVPDIDAAAGAATPGLPLLRRA